MRKQMFLFSTVFFFVINILLPAPIYAENNLSLSDYDFNRWADIIYQHCQNYDEIVADCFDCVIYTSEKICSTGIEVRSEPTIKCNYRTSEINKNTIADLLRKVDGKYGRDLGQRNGNVLFACITSGGDRALHLTRRETYLFEEQYLQDFYSGNQFFEQNNNQFNFNSGGGDINIRGGDQMGFMSRLFDPWVNLLVSFFSSTFLVLLTGRLRGNKRKRVKSIVFLTFVLFVLIYVLQIFV